MANIRRRWLAYTVEAAVLLAIFLAVAAWQKRDLVEGAAPPLAGITVDGKPFDLEPLRGSTVVVHFWAGWCPICRAQEGTITSLAADPSYNVITVAMKSGTPSEVREHLQERQLVLPTLVDSNGDVARAWGVTGVPATFVIDSGGAIRFREMGYTTEPGLRLRLWWANQTGG